jgi:hypothetical protein
VLIHDVWKVLLVQDWDQQGMVCSELKLVQWLPVNKHAAFVTFPCQAADNKSLEPA